MPKKKKKSVYRPTSPAVEQAAQLLLCIGKASAGHMSLTEICKQIGIHKSKGYSILNALGQYDLISRDSDTKAYSLGPALIPLGRKVREKLDINVLAKDHLQKLAHETKATVLFGIVSNDQFYIAGKYDGNATISVTVRQYHFLHITHGAHGKAIFAHLDEEEQQRIMAGNEVFFYGDSKSLDEKRLKKELKACREKGYAVDNGEVTDGLKAVSAPVFDHNNRVMAGIALVGTFSEDKIPCFGEKTATVAKIISKQAGAEMK